MNTPRYEINVKTPKCPDWSLLYVRLDNDESSPAIFASKEEAELSLFLCKTIERAGADYSTSARSFRIIESSGPPSFVPLNIPDSLSIV